LIHDANLFFDDKIARGDGFLLISGVFGGITDFVATCSLLEMERLQLVIDLYI
jgi:hypothetical protein